MEGERIGHYLEEEDYSTSTPSSFSGDDSGEPVMPPSPKKRRGAQKKVVSVPIGGADGGWSQRSKAEVYPPPDSWSWRKYGQKPIKGSPYPRGYYRCSSSKGCPARKQVERSRLDPTLLLITYSHDHNHPLPTTTHKHHHHHRHQTTPPASSPPTTDDAVVPPSFPPEEFAMFANQPDLEPDKCGFSEFMTAELGWLSDTTMLDSPTFVGPKWADADVTVMLPIGEEDQSLFGDLGELPECSVVFRRRASGDI